MAVLQARNANEVLKAQERKMRLLEPAWASWSTGPLAAAMVFRLARQERDVWSGWPARVAAMMAAA